MHLREHVGLLRWGLAILVASVVGNTPILGLAEEGKSGVEPSKVNHPRGPGSLESIGENAQPSVNMGTVSYTVPIDIPGGYNGFSPSVSLAYSSANGSSVVGIGWSFDVPRIERMTARGLPKYTVNDLFAANGGDELVRIPGTQTFRARYEGGFVRYTWVDAANEGRRGYWKAEYPDGRVGYFGASAEGEVQRSSRVEGFEGTFSYQLVEMVDVYDHRIRYRYSKDSGRPYLESVHWVFGSDGARYEVRLAYEGRADALVDAKPGVEVRLAKRLASIQILVGGNQLRRYKLLYEPYNLTGGLTRLAKIETYGTSDEEAHPVAFSFRYSGSFDPACENQTGCDRPYLHEMGRLGVDFAGGKADLNDMTGDGLPDVVDTTNGVHVFHINTLTSTNHSFSKPVESQVANGGSIILSAPHVELYDVDGNGFSDMVDALNNRVLWNRGVGEWQEDPQAASRHLPDLSQDANLLFLDVDHDRNIDCFHADASGTWYYLNQGDGTFAEAPVHLEALGWGLSRDGLKTADMNGDGMLDMVLLFPGGAAYRPNLGFGRFGRPVEMFGLSEDSEKAQSSLQDLNGDNLADFVVVEGNEVRFSLNRNGLTFGELTRIKTASGGSIPERTHGVSVRFADMNGSGSVDVVWIDASGKVVYLEIFPQRPNLLARVENGIGKVIEFFYGTSVGHMARDGGPTAWTHRLPHPMLTLDRLETYDTLSGVRQVQEFRYRNGYYDGLEKQFRGFMDVEVHTFGDVSIEPGRVLHHFEVGQRDPYRKSLLLSRQMESNGRVLERFTYTYEDCHLDGVSPAPAVPIRYLCQTSEKRVIQEGTEQSDWVTILETTRFDGYGNATLVTKHGVTQQSGGSCDACEFDPTNVHGAPCGPSCLGDEMFEETQFVPIANTGGRWIVGAPFRRRIYGVPGREATEEIIYYDGEPFVGLPFGHLTRGQISKVTQKIEWGRSEVISAQRNEYDLHGNTVATKDPNGHLRRFAYNDHGLLPIAEDVVFDDPGHPPYLLRQELRYHPVLETPIASTAWMRIEGSANVSDPRWTMYDYDVFGRLMALARPGDSLTSPTQVFEYELVDPVSRITTRSRTEAKGPLDLESIECFDGLGRRIQERVLVEPKVYQVSGFSVFNIQGKPRQVHQPYMGAAATCDRVAPEEVQATETFFDATGRPVHVLHPDATIYGTASEERTHYLPLRTVAFDSEDLDATSPHYGTPTMTGTDGQGRTTLIQRFLSDGSTPIITRFTYDTLGRIRSVIDNHGNEKVQTYDLLSRTLTVDDPDAGLTTFGYDAAGNRTRVVGARGITTRHSYDEVNRIKATWDSTKERRLELAPEARRPVVLEVVMRPEERGDADLLVEGDRPRGSGVRGRDPAGRRSGGADRPRREPAPAGSGPRPEDPDGLLAPDAIGPSPTSICSGGGQGLEVPVSWAPGGHRGSGRRSGGSTGGRPGDRLERWRRPALRCRARVPTGTERFVLPGGRWDVAVSSPRWGTQVRSLTVSNDDSTGLKQIRVRMLPPDDDGGAMQLTVADADGRPVDGARVTPGGPTPGDDHRGEPDGAIPAPDHGGGPGRGLRPCSRVVQRIRVTRGHPGRRPAALGPRCAAGRRGRSRWGRWMRCWPPPPPAGGVPTHPAPTGGPCWR